MPVSTKRKAPAKLAAPVVKSSAKKALKSNIDESRTSVAGTDNIASSQLETISISSDANSDEDISDDDAIDTPEMNGGKEMPHVNGKQIGQLPSPNNSGPLDDAAEDSDAEATSPSFGELLRGNEAIDVPALLQQSSTGNAVAQPRTAIVPPTHQSLTTVLSQALRTDDTDLLESCLHTTDLPTIRNTIERIDSSLAGTLLNKLAARLYRRPGRAGNLMTWVQWTLVSHGGALASQPKVVHGLSGLQNVLSERAKGLSSLLALKGKLDLLEGQMDLRRNMQRRSGLSQQIEDEEDDEHLIWVEGETDGVGERDLANGIGSRRKRAVDDDDSEDDEDDVPAMNGFVGDSDDEEEDSEDEDDSDAAEESLDEDEVDHDDVDESMGEDEESDVEAAPPSKMQKTTKSFSKRK